GALARVCPGGAGPRRALLGDPGPSARARGGRPAALRGDAPGAGSRPGPAGRAACRRRRRAGGQPVPVWRPPAGRAPVPRDGAVRRLNQAAGELLGTGSGYATGRPFTAFVNLPSRAAVDSLLTAVIRTGKPRQVRCELLTGAGTTECELIAGLARPRGDTD